MRAMLALVIALVLAAAVPAPAASAADVASISRDAMGSQPTGDHAPLGGPPTPQLYLLGQTTIFCAGVVLLVAAAALGVYTLVSVRRAGPRRVV